MGQFIPKYVREIINPNNTYIDSSNESKIISNDNYSNESKIISNDNYSNESKKRIKHNLHVIKLIIFNKINQLISESIKNQSTYIIEYITTLLNLKDIKVYNKEFIEIYTKYYQNRALKYRKFELNPPPDFCSPDLYENDIHLHIENMIVEEYKIAYYYLCNINNIEELNNLSLYKWDHNDHCIFDKLGRTSYKVFEYAKLIDIDPSYYNKYAYICYNSFLQYIIHHDKYASICYNYTIYYNSSLI